MQIIIAQFISKIMSELSQERIENLLDALAKIIGSFEVITYPANETLCREGDDADTFYAIGKGEVAVYKQLEENEEKVLLATKGPGEFFGEMAFITDEPRSADVVTTQECTMLELGRQTFKRAMRLSPELEAFMSGETMNYHDNWQHKEVEKRGREYAPFQVFTSYARADEEWASELVEKIQEHLSDNNVTIWMDQINIKLGEEWDKAIENALDDSRAMLLIMSQNSVESDNVRDEWSQFLEDKGKRCIIPVVMEDCKRPTRLRRLQYVDFSRLSYNKALVRIHKTILDLAAGVDESVKTG